MTLPRILLLGIGGTIASSASSRTQTTEYRLTGTAATLISELPELSKIAQVDAEQISNITSQEVDTPTLLALSKRANTALQSDGYDGIVVIHGTDTLEETAYFLNLSVISKKPVVVAGAMRPASALSSDGPSNLYEAVQVAADPSAAGRGVMVVANGVIAAARWVSKANTTGLDAFTSPGSQIGRISGGRIGFDRAVLLRHTFESEFDLSGLNDLPIVDIVLGHQGLRAGMFQAAIDTGAHGLVFAATGNGTLPASAKDAIRIANEKGVVFVRASRVPHGAVTPKASPAGLNTVSSGSLSPQKARIALQLALTRSKNVTRIQEIFDTY